MSGRFVTFEGIDGAGKSTHVGMLADWLRGRGHDVVLTREPGGSDVAERLRELVLHSPMDALTETLVVFAARRDHLRERIEPALARGATVLCDRFTDASFAYQGGGRGVPQQVLQTLESWVQHGRQPDLTLWFDLPPALAAQRRGAARDPDRFEQQDEAYITRVRDGYARRCADAPARFVRIDAQRERDEVAAELRQMLEARGW
jgi:dTMP kinase